MIAITFLCPTLTAQATTIMGKVSFKGTPPPPQKIKVEADPTCAALHQGEVTQEDVLVNSNGTLRNVFVYIQKGLEGKKFETPKNPVVLDQKGCLYTPHVFGLVVNQPLEILNSDPTLHNVHALPKKNKEFNLGMPIQGMKLAKSFSAPEVMIKFKCEVHPWMAGYAGVLEHPFFGVTDEAGSFELKDVPAGEYTVAAWHERYGEMTQKISVGENQSKTIEFTYEASAQTQAAAPAPSEKVPEITQGSAAEADVVKQDSAAIAAYKRSKHWWLPDPVSTYANKLDFLFYLILYITGAVFLGVQSFMLYFLIRYRNRPNRKAHYTHGNSRIEVIWTVIPAIILIFLTVLSQKTWSDVRGEIPENAMPIQVMAEQFAWNIKYAGADGKFGTNDDIIKMNQMHIPAGQPVRVQLTSISKDGKHPVIHSFFLPEFRIKQDVVPGLPTEIWFEATKPGRFEIACAELCGLGHYRMRGFLTVHTPEGFEAWLAQEMAKTGK